MVSRKGMLVNNDLTSKEAINLLEESKSQTSLAKENESLAVNSSTVMGFIIGTRYLA